MSGCFLFTDDLVTSDCQRLQAVGARGEVVTGDPRSSSVTPLINIYIEYSLFHSLG